MTVSQLTNFNEVLLRGLLLTTFKMLPKVIDLILKAFSAMEYLLSELLNQLFLHLKHLLVPREVFFIVLKLHLDLRVLVFDLSN